MNLQESVFLRMNTQILSDAKKSQRKKSLGNKAARVIELGKGLPTISLLSDDQGL